MNRLQRKVKTASEFTRSDWKLIAEVYALFLKARLLLLVSPAESTVKRLSPRSSKACPKSSSHSKQELLRLFGVAKRYQLRRPKCLLSSLAKHIFLARHGYPTSFRIGVQNENGTFKAHAWCADEEDTADGKNIREGNFEVMKPLSSFDDEASS